MTPFERLQHQINVLYVTIRLDWKVLGPETLTEDQRMQLGSHIGACQDALTDLWTRLDDISNPIRVSETDGGLVSQSRGEEVS